MNEEEKWFEELKHYYENTPKVSRLIAYVEELREKIVVRDAELEYTHKSIDKMYAESIEFSKRSVQLQKENKRLKKEIVVVVNRDIERFGQCERLKAELENIKPTVILRELL